MIEYLRAQWEQRPFLVIVAVTAPIAFVITFLAILAANGGGGRSAILSLPEEQSQSQSSAVVLQQQEQQTPVVRVSTSGSARQQQQATTISSQPARAGASAQAAADGQQPADSSGAQSQQSAAEQAGQERVVSERLPRLSDVLAEEIDMSSLRYGGTGEDGAVLPIDNGVVPSSGPRFHTSWELMVPSARIYATINKVGRAPGGAMGAPDNPEVIGWLDSSAAPGEPGNALMVGHRDYTDINGKVGWGVCWELDKSRLGDAIIVLDNQNELAYVYEIIEKVTIDPKDEDAKRYLRQTEEAVVTLITCNGSFDVTTHSYSHRLVLVGLLRHVTRA